MVVIVLLYLHLTCLALQSSVPDSSSVGRWDKASVSFPSLSVDPSSFSTGFIEVIPGSLAGLFFPLFAGAGGAVLLFSPCRLRVWWTSRPPNLGFSRLSWERRGGWLCFGWRGGRCWWPPFSWGRRLSFQLLSSSFELCTYNNIPLLLADDSFKKVIQQTLGYWSICLQTMVHFPSNLLGSRIWLRALPCKMSQLTTSEAYIWVVCTLRGYI